MGLKSIVKWRIQSYIGLVLLVLLLYILASYQTVPSSHSLLGLPTSRSLSRTEDKSVIKRFWSSSVSAEDYIASFHQCETVGFQPQPATLSQNVTGQNGLCSLKTFKTFYQTYHRFPGEGHWCLNKKTNYTFRQFVPSMCQFAFADIPSQSMKQCLVAKRIKKIVTIGDSQGGRHHAALFGELSKYMDRCEIVKAEHNGKLDINLDPSYLVRTNWTHYDKANVPDTLKDFGCRVCIGILRKCSYTVEGKRHTILLEHLRMSQQTKDSPYLKYLFQTYLQGERTPDYVIVITPVNHLKRNSIDSFLDLIVYIHDLMMSNLRDTNILWIPGAREVELNKPDKYKNELFAGSTATKKINEMNTGLYKKLERHLEDPNSRVNGFYDLLNISRDSWSTDGLHFLPMWYSQIQQQLLQTLCTA